MADYVKHGGHVVSFVNITSAKVVDGGEVRVSILFLYLEFCLVLEKNP